MKNARQQSFFKKKIHKFFGGSLLKSNPKTKRPISTTQAIHLVLKSQHAVGKHSMLHSYNTKKIEFVILAQAKCWGIKIYHYVNVGNHLHLVIKLNNRRSFNLFIRAITGLIARHVLNAERGSAKEVQFWAARPFTRIISWGRDYLNINKYMKKNKGQAKERFKVRFVAWGFDITNSDSILNLNTG